MRHKSEEDIIRSVSALGRLHKVMKMEGERNYQEKSLKEEYMRHNQELRKIRKFIRSQRGSVQLRKDYLDKRGVVSGKRREGACHAGKDGI